MMDPKEDSFQWCSEKWGPSGNLGHFWQTIGDAVDGVRCVNPRCGGDCKLPEPGETDICLACGPCQPYSKQGRTGLPPERHALHSVIFGETDSIIALAVAVRPLIFVTENVFGFGEMRSKGEYTDQSPKTAFISQMYKKVRDYDGSPWFGGHADVPTCSGDWVQGRRPRFYIVFWAHRAGGGTAAACFGSRWQDIYIYIYIYIYDTYSMRCLLIVIRMSVRFVFVF